MTPRLLPGPVIGLNGMADLPASKSVTNRALIASAAAGGGRIVRPLDCDDTRVLATALEHAGWSVQWGDADIDLGVRTVPTKTPHLDLRDSGTGSRLLIGLLAASPGRSVVDGSSRLRERPIGPLYKALRDLGAHLTASGDRLPVEVEGTEIEGGMVAIRPEVSSQFVSSLLLAAPLMPRGLEVRVLGNLPSAPYLDLTMDVLRRFGADVQASLDRRLWRVGPGPLRPETIEVEGDWSAAAFFLAAAAVAGGTVEIGPLDPASRQGDRVAIRVLVEAGLDIQWAGDRLTVRGPVTAPLVADLEQAPDLFPALAAVAACAPPGSRFSGLAHLRHKESDRLGVMVENLGRLGADCVVDGDRLELNATVRTLADSPRSVTAAGDHRVAMAMAVAALGAGPLEVDDGSCVSKSFPGFWPIWATLTRTSRRQG